jgi:aminopeptidase N
MAALRAESTAQILNYYNDYFGVHYPLPKLDRIAIPRRIRWCDGKRGGITYFELTLVRPAEIVHHDAPADL